MAVRYRLRRIDNQVYLYRITEEYLGPIEKKQSEIPRRTLGELRKKARAAHPEVYQLTE